MVTHPLRATRRQFLQATTAAALGPAVVPSAADGKEGLAVKAIIDTHTHFYDPTRPQGVPWPGKDDKLLYRPVLPDEYQKLTKPLSVTGTVIVEASPWVEDNQWVLELSDRNAFIVGVVGNLAPGSAEFSRHLDRFSKHPRFRGIRVSHAAVKSGLSEKKFLADIHSFADHDLELDINGGPDMLPDIAR